MNLSTQTGGDTASAVAHIETSGCIWQARTHVQADYLLTFGYLLIIIVVIKKGNVLLRRIPIVFPFLRSQTEKFPVGFVGLTACSIVLLGLINILATSCWSTTSFQVSQSK